jgi:hypothetical protein
MKGVDYEVFRKDHAEIISIVGNCPLSCNDLIESMQSGDAMCLALDVGRSEACVADPTRLIIKDIIPTFMGANSFLDSSAFNI